MKVNLRQFCTAMLAVIVLSLFNINIVHADNIRGININFVNIGHAGNAADTGGTVGCGAVGYNYRIGKYEVTNAQWNTFTTAAGAPTGNDGGYSNGAYFTGAQQPTNEVSWYEAAQFCNWLTSGDKSKGAYQFSGSNAAPGSFLGINRVSSISTYGTTYVIPTENEWYKAAYFKPNGSGYSLYANGTNTAPSTSDTCYSIYSSPWNIGNGTMEQNGTFNIMGNVWEWNETLISGFYPVIRGGSYYDSVSSLASSYRGIVYPYFEFNGVGFRVAEILEPATLLLLGFGAFILKRKLN